MTAGGAASSRFRYYQIERDLPFTEGRSHRTGQLRTIGGVGLVTGATASPLAIVYDMNVVKVSFPVTKLCIYGCFGEVQQIFLVAFEAKSVRSFTVGSIVGRRVRSRQETKIVGTVGVMTTGASPQGDGAVDLRFSLQLIGDIFQWSQRIVPMTPQTERFFVRGKELPDVGSMRGVA